MSKEDWHEKYSTWRERMAERERFREQNCNHCYFKRRIEEDLKAPLPEEAVEGLKEIFDLRCSACKGQTKQTF